MAKDTLGLSSFQAARPGERRQLTVVFCDLVGSTALSSRLDPEDMREIIGAFHRCCTEHITKSGGFVAKYIGDGALAYYGYPQAHEDEAERAIRAALALADAVPRIPATHGVILQVRIGIATGIVVVGELIGEGAAQERGVIGETPNLAARLQNLAEPGQVVISHSTRRLAGGLFEYRAMGPVGIKGFTEPMQAWRVLGASAVRSRFDAQHQTGFTPLVGRDEEMDVLRRCWRQAMRGQGQVVLLSGEPGIGKSRLAVALQESLHVASFTRVRCFCSPHHKDTAFYPTLSQIERAAGLRHDDTDEQRLDKLEALLAQATDELSEAVALLAGLLSIPTGDRYPPLNLTARQRKEKMFKVLITQVEGLAARQPVLMLVEDVHWIDPTSLEMLDLLVDRAPSLPMLLIINFRPEFTPPWIGRSHVAMLSLTRLPVQQRAEMIACVTEGKALPKPVADQIIERTDGVPLFIEELTKAVVESGVVADTGDHYRLAGPSAPLAIPATLQGSLLARLDRLASVRDVAQIGAALGRRFSHELISAVASMPQEQLDDALAQLVAAELIFRSGTPPEAEYTFKHVLVQDAAYGALLRGRRRQLHARIAETLESQFPDIVATEPALLARHCTEAALHEKAVSYRLKAGRRAIAHSAMTEAIAQLRNGLDLLANLPETRWRTQHELDLRLTLGQALTAKHGYAAAVAGEAYAHAFRLGKVLDEPRRLAPVLHGQYAHHLVRGEIGLALERAEAVWRLGAARDDTVLISLGHRFAGHARVALGEFAQALAELQESRVLFDPAQRGVFHALGGDVDTGVVTQALQSWTLTCLGRLDGARKCRETALADARQLAHAFTLAFALCIACYCERSEGAADIGMLRANELLAMSEEYGFPHWKAIATIIRGWCLSVSGRPDEGVAELTQGLAAYCSTGAVLQLPLFFTSLAEACGEAQRPAEGLRHLAKAVGVVEATQDRWAEAEMYRVRGALLLALGDRAAAEQGYHQALAVAQLQDAKLWQLRAATSLAWLWREQGKRRDARNLIAPIYGGFAEGFDIPDLKSAKTLLDELYGASALI